MRPSIASFACQTATAHNGLSVLAFTACAGRGPVSNFSDAEECSASVRFIGGGSGDKIRRIFRRRDRCEDARRR